VRDRTASGERPYEWAVTARITGTRCSIDAVLVSLFILLSLYCYFFFLLRVDCVTAVWEVSARDMAAP